MVKSSTNIARRTGFHVAYRFYVALSYLCGVYCPMDRDLLAIGQILYVLYNNISDNSDIKYIKI